MSCTRTKNYEVQTGVAPCVGLTPTTAEKWGGGTYPTVSEIYPTMEPTIPNQTPDFYENLEQTGNVNQNNDEIVALPVADAINTHVYAESVGTCLFAGLAYADLSGPHVDGSLYAHIFEIRGAGRDQCSYTDAEAVLATANASLSPAYDSGDIVNADITILKSYGPADYKVGNARCENFTIAGNQKEAFKIDMSFVCEDLEKDESKVESGAWSLTASNFTNMFRMHQTSCLANGVSTGIFDFSVEIPWVLASDRYPTGTLETGLRRAEPVTDGNVMPTVSFTVEKHSDLVWENFRDNKTIIPFKIEATQADGKFLGIYIAELQVTGVDVDANDGSRQSITAKATNPQSAIPFATERTFTSGGPIALMHNPSVFMILKNSKTVNYMRQA